MKILFSKEPSYLTCRGTLILAAASYVWGLAIGLFL